MISWSSFPFVFGRLDCFMICFLMMLLQFPPLTQWEWEYYIGLLQSLIALECLMFVGSYLCYYFREADKHVSLVPMRFSSVTVTTTSSRWLCLVCVISVDEYHMNRVMMNRVSICWVVEDRWSTLETHVLFWQYLVLSWCVLSLLCYTSPWLLC